MIPKIRCTADVECYRNYFLLKVKDVDTGRYHEFEMFPGHPLDVLGVRMCLAVRTIYGFNWQGYDACIVTAALAGYDNASLKTFNDEIIVNRVKWWDFYQLHDLPRFEFDYVDLMEVAPGVRISLKMYAGRMHSVQMQDLPIEPSQLITAADRPLLRQYCGNDLDVTHDMLDQLGERLALRDAIGQQYRIDVRSKSDAQIAEAVIKAKLPFKPQRHTVPHGHRFRYNPPAWVKFQTPELQDVLRIVSTTDFVVHDVEQIKRFPTEEIYDLDGVKVTTGLVLPAAIKGRDIRIGKHGVYRIGIGGLHSQEARRAIYSTATHVLTDHDVASYYPTLILLAGLFPPAIGEQFLAIYREIYDQRIAAKRAAGDMSTDEATRLHWQIIADSLKITLNGAFGKLGSKYSILFAPELLIQTTITGQLALLMLIERMELAGIDVMSANTDGIVLSTQRSATALRDRIVTQWEQDTGLQTEATEYLAMFNRSVNDYVAFTAKGKVKRKGATFAVPGLMSNKHPDREICADAVVEYLARGTPVETTVRACRDIRKFLRIRQVAGGGIHTGTGEYLGKAVRWYWGRDNSVAIVNREGNRVAGSEGAVPCMRLPDKFPDDLDYEYYIRECYSILYDVGISYVRAA